MKKYNRFLRISILFSIILLNSTVVFSAAIITMELQRSENLGKKLADAAFSGYSGDIDEVQRLLDAGANVNELGKLGFTALIASAKLGNLEIAKLLIKHKANVDVSIYAGCTALMHAAGVGRAAGQRKDIVKLLLDSGADVNHRDKNDSSPLIDAVRAEQVDTVELLLNNKADVNVTDCWYTPLIWAVVHDNIKIVGLLLNANAGVNAIDKLESTALNRAVYKKNVGIVKLLIKSKADLNIRDSDGNSALMLAIDKKYIDIVRLLLSAGAEIPPDFTVYLSNYNLNISNILSNEPIRRTLVILVWLISEGNEYIAKKIGDATNLIDPLAKIISEYMTVEYNDIPLEYRLEN